MVGAELDDVVAVGGVLVHDAHVEVLLAGELLPADERHDLVAHDLGLLRDVVELVHAFPNVCKRKTRIQVDYFLFGPA